MSAVIELSADHQYTVDGIAYAGVTTVIGSVIRKPALEKWIGELGNAEAERQRSQAADHGTLVHALAALVVEGVPSIPMDADEALSVAQVEAFTSWYEKHVECVHAVELQVASDRYQYAGTLDYLVRMKGDRRPTLIDVKSGKAVYAEFRYQTAAYRHALLWSEVWEEYGYERHDCRRGVLHIPRDAEGPARFYEHRRHEADLQGFLSCLYLFHDLKRGL